MLPEKPSLIIPIFLPHQGCPHQCAFCNQQKISGAASGLPSRETLVKEVNRYLAFGRNKTGPIQIAFYGGNFLGIPFASIRPLLDEAQAFIRAGKVASIRFSTRPDTITPQSLSRLQTYTVSTIELGAQSMDDRILSLSNRGHTAMDTTAAVARIRQRGLQLGIQMMTGLPGDEGRQSIETAEQIAELEPDFVRIYPTIVLAGSPLAAAYKNGDYTPMPLERSVQLVAQIYSLFTERGIPVIRTGLQASDGLSDQETVLAGPFHPAYGHLVMSEIFLEAALKQLRQEKGITDREVSLLVHEKDVSKMRGLNNRNIHTLKQMFPVAAIRVVPDPFLSKGQVALQICREEKTKA